MFELSQITEVSIIASIGAVNLVLGILLSGSYRSTVDEAKTQKETDTRKKKKKNMQEQERKKAAKDLPEKKNPFRRKNSPPEDLAGLIAEKEQEEVSRKIPSEEHAAIGKSQSTAEESAASVAPKKENAEEAASLYLVSGRDKDGNLILTDEGIISNRLAEDGEFKIGGKKTADYIVKNDYISGTHAIISKHGGKYYIMDISRNGTRISAIPYRKDADPMMYPLQIGKEEELLNGTLIELASKVELLFRYRRG